MEKEIWKSIEFLGFYYQVSNMGNVRSLNREFINVSGHHRKLKGKVIKQTPDKNGYMQVGFHSMGRVKTKKVHRLVAGLFIPNPDNKPQVNHINGIKSDNRVENLEWVTDIENKKHANETGLSRYLTGKDHRLYGTNGNTPKKAINIKTGKIYDTIKDAAKDYGIGYHALSKRLTGKYKNDTPIRYFNKNIQI